MSADCWACKTKVGYISITRGTKGNPLGCCKNCNSFACGYHGYRDAHEPEYICAECIPGWIASSVADDELERSPNPSDQPPLQQMKDLFPAGKEFRINWQIKSVEQLKEIFGDYYDEIFSGIDRYVFNSSPFTTTKIRLKFPAVTAANKKLLIAAGLLIKILYAGRNLPGRYPLYLKFLAENVTLNDNDNLNLHDVRPVEDPA